MTTYHAPPKRVGVWTEVFGVDLFLDNVHEKRGENQTEKPDVKRCKQFLPTQNSTRENGLLIL